MKILNSRVESVTVYRSGAFVSRVLEVNAKDSFPEQIVIPLLPLALYDPMVRVRVQNVTGSKVPLQASNVRVGLYAPPRDTIEAPRVAELKQIQRELLRKSRQLQQLELEMTILVTIEVPNRPSSKQGKPPPASPMAARLALEKFTNASIKQRITERNELRKQIKELDLSVSELQNELDRASDAIKVKPGELTKSVTVTLHSTDSKLKKAQLLLEYFIPGARWAPAYQVNFSQHANTANVQLRAVVCQHSGENWDAVKLHLSTAAPLSWSELPELSALRMGKQQNPTISPKGFRAAPIGAEVLFNDYDIERTRTADLVPPSPSWAYPELTINDLQKLARPVCEQEEIYQDQFLENELPAADAGTGAKIKQKRSRARLRKSRVHMTYESDHMRNAPRSSTSIPRSLAYTQLSLAAANDMHARNKLHAIDVNSRYLNTLQTSSAGVMDGSLSDTVQRATNQASAVASLTLPDGMANVATVTGHFDYSYSTDALVDVPSDGCFHSIALGRREAECDMRYVVVPREDSNVYRVVTLSNPSQAPMLPGPAEVYVNNEYVLTSQLPMVAANGKFLLGLGVEQSIKCARNTHFTEKRSGEKVVAMRELHHHIEIDIVNNLKREIVCEIRERIPQADKDAEVVVDELKITPSWQPYDQLHRAHRVIGGRRWEAVIKAGDTAQFNAKYVIKLYANNELIGGNRREL